MTTPLLRGGRISTTRLRAASAALTLAGLFAPAVFALSLTLATVASAAVLKVLHNFTGKDGSIPVARLLFDSAGNLYGVSQGGGSETESECVGYGCGVAFEMKPTSSGKWTYQVIHTFCLLKYCADGAFPSGGLVSDSAGNLYGATQAGGNTPACSGYGCGVVYRLSPTPSGRWKYTVLFPFPDGSGGAYPHGTLTWDSAGNLYGTAVNGGIVGGSCAFAPGCGLLFELTPNPEDSTWTEKVLYIFAGGADGALPQGGVIFDSSGNLYGTTEAGGINNFRDCVLQSCGVVFQLTPNPDGTWQQTLIHSFTGGSDGATSTASLIFDAMGNLYGTSSEGGWGDVFQFAPNPNGGWTESVIGSPGGTTYAAVLRTPSGNLYGTTANGGGHSAGFVFEYRHNPDDTWTESIIYTFCSHIQHYYCVDGAGSYADLITDSTGNLYGVAALGGQSNHGIVFELHKFTPDMP